MKNETYASPKTNLSPDIASTDWPDFKVTRYLNNTVAVIFLIIIVVTLISKLEQEGSEYIYLAILIPIISIFWLVSFSLKKRERMKFRLVAFIVNSLICILFVTILVLSSEPIPSSVFIVVMFFLNVSTLYKARLLQ